MIDRSAQGRLRSTAVRVLVPLVVAAVTFAAALQYPSSSVHGNPRTGPLGDVHGHRVVLEWRPTLSWGPGRQKVVLTMHPRDPCRLVVRSVAATAPGRLDVRVRLSGSSCSGRRVAQRIELPVPAIQDPRRTVRVDVNQQVLRLRWSRVGPHPSGALDS